MSICTWFASSALLALSWVPAAHAGDELYLRWDNCFGDGGTYNKVFACDTNAGSDVLVGSFRLAATTDSVSTVEIRLNLTALDPTLPPWWSVRATAPLGCRPTSLTASFSAPATSNACLDPWTPLGAVGGLSMDAPFDNTALVRVLLGLPSPIVFKAEAGQEIFTFQLRIDHARTVGTSTCVGCNTPVCIAWGWAWLQRLLPAPGLGEILGAATPDNGSNVTWQPGAVATTQGECSYTRGCNGWVTCQSATPTRRSTWGSIKSLYR